jgi:hypothetical protein
VGQRLRWPGDSAAQYAVYRHRTEVVLEDAPFAQPRRPIERYAVVRAIRIVAHGVHRHCLHARLVR